MSELGHISTRRKLAVAGAAVGALAAGGAGAMLTGGEQAAPPSGDRVAAATTTSTSELPDPIYHTIPESTEAPATTIEAVVDDAASVARGRIEGNTGVVIGSSGTSVERSAPTTTTLLPTSVGGPENAGGSVSRDKAPNGEQLQQEMIGFGHKIIETLNGGYAADGKQETNPDTGETRTWVVTESVAGDGVSYRQEALQDKDGRFTSINVSVLKTAGPDATADLLSIEARDALNDPNTTTLYYLVDGVQTPITTTDQQQAVIRNLDTIQGAAKDQVSITTFEPIPGA